MENKLLTVGSILSVVVLVLAGLSPVVGFDSVRSSMKDSPLFSTRINNAIDKGQDTLECNYVGKGEIMPFPRQVTKTAMILELIDRLSTLNDKEFNEFIISTITLLEKDNSFENEQLDNIIQVIQELRNNPRDIKNVIGDINYRGVTDSVICTSDGQWEPGCYIINILMFLVIQIILIPYYIIVFISYLLPSCEYIPTCISKTYTVCCEFQGIT